MEKIIDEKVDRILHPPKEGQEDEEKLLESENKEENKIKSPDEEPKDLLEASMEENKKRKKAIKFGNSMWKWCFFYNAQNAGIRWSIRH